MKIEIELQEKQELFEKTVEKTPITLFGGAKGGGKSGGLRRIVLLRRLQYPKSTAGIFRKTYPELDGNHIRKLFQEYPQLRQYYQETKKLLTLPNGSTIEFCYCASEKDLDNYQGREFDDLCIDEAGQWTEVMIKRLMESNRSSGAGIPPRTMLTGNPGGLGHTYLKRVFIQRKFKPEERPQDYAFIQALVDDNKALMKNDPDYVHKLNNEPNLALRKAFRFGDWDIFAGQFFGELSRDVHVIKPFDIPPHWNRFGAYDYGFNHPAAFGWFANDEDGNTYLYRELVRSGVRVDEFVRLLKQYPDTKLLYPVIGGLDCWAKRTNTIRSDQPDPPKIADEFAHCDENNNSDYPIILKPAVVDRISGAAQVRSYLALRDAPNNTKKPRFYIFDTCEKTFDCLSRMINDPDRVEDVLKVDATEGDPDTGDDAYDMVRYGLMSRPVITDKPINKPPLYSKEWHKQQSDIHQHAADEVWEKEREALIENQNNWPEY